MLYQNKIRCCRRNRKGAVLGLIVIFLIILMIGGIAILRTSEGAAKQAVMFKTEAASLAAAEAAYEKAIAWMCQSKDLLMNLETDGTVGSVEFDHSRADYSVLFHGFSGYRPIYEVSADGYSGIYHRSIRVYVSQAISGWEMGMCRIPNGTSSTSPVSFAKNETIDMPIHINSYRAPDDSERDIHLSGDPLFLQSVSMGESRYSSGGSDKYSSVINYFDAGIIFNQPTSLINDGDSVQKKMDWYKSTIYSDRADQAFKPVKSSKVSGGLPAVQLEFFIDSQGRGSVRITKDCTVVGYLAGGSTLDYKVRPGSNGTRFDKYPIYGYHYISDDAENDGTRFTRLIRNMNVTPEYGGVDGPPFGMIYVDGNVIIGSCSENASNPNMTLLNVVQGKMMVVATGNIWMTHSVVVSDKDDEGRTYPRQDDGKPGMENPNVLGLMSQGVVKVVDPGMVEDLTGSGGWKWVGRGRNRVRVWVEGGPSVIAGLKYEPIGVKNSSKADYTSDRYLPDPTVVEAAITVGGGGWGAEHVGNRKETSGRQDDLLVRGSITEVIRGVVGYIGSDGYLKQYYFDSRLMTGIIPGNTNLKGKFVAVPGGWSDFRVDQKPKD